MNPRTTLTFLHEALVSCLFSFYPSRISPEGELNPNAARAPLPCHLTDLPGSAGQHRLVPQPTLACGLVAEARVVRLPGQPIVANRLNHLGVGRAAGWLCGTSSVAACVCLCACGSAGACVILCAHDHAVAAVTQAAAVTPQRPTQ
jgi:hypothetical protein